VAERVGAEVRVRRNAAGLTIAEVARRAAVSAPFISQLEAGRTSISIPTLYRVAAALGCTANALLGPGHDHGDERRNVIRSGDGLRLAAGSGLHVQEPRLLSRTGPDVLMEAYHYVLQPDEDEMEWFEHDGEDFVYVVSGSIGIEFDDGEISLLAAGDSLHHAGTTPHRWLLQGNEPAEVLIVVAAPPRP
jgi:transcriptional regulator with XRE-family HTH domain